LTTSYREIFWDEVSFNMRKSMSIPPFYQLNSQGLSGKRSLRLKSNLKNDVEVMGVLSEISVTKLSSLIRCPKKYYLENICKLDDEEIDILNEVVKTDNEFLKVKKNNVSNSLNKSSKERGIIVHSFFENYFGDHYSENLNFIEKEVKFKYSIEIVASFRSDYVFLFEKLLKFPFFNFMMSGQPDLLLIPKEEGKIFRIIDFKTGDRSKENEEVYIFQLYAYALACFELNLLGKMASLNIGLLYVDVEEFVENTLNYNEVLDKMTQYLSKLSHLSLVNRKHCPLCTFKNICGPQVAQID